MRTIAIDLGGTAVKLGLFRDGHLAESHELALDHTGISLAELERAALGRFGAGERVTDARPAFDAVGIAVPGIVDPQGARLVAAHGKYPALHDVDLVAWSAARLGAPAIVENDARAALIGETSDGVARGARHAVLLTLGTGIGTAALVDGRPLRGPHGHAGILGGHVTVELEGPRCPCGNVGCAEAIASTWALREAAARGELELGPALMARFDATRALGIRDLIDTRDDASSAAILDRFIDVWAAVVVTQCHAFDPEVVVVTGGVLRSADVILPTLTERVHAHLWSSSFRPPLVTPDDPSTSVLRGLHALATHSTASDRKDHR